MGESSACLVRSFSQPSPTSSGEKKGNPLQRVLTTSVSFGRFMSESLDWEKWSAFTHNRYLEEAEKYSKPGSVAEKKAYFEAHFKRRRAAKLLEQQNAAASVLPTTSTVEDNSSFDSDLAPRDSSSVNENIKEGEVQTREPDFPVPQNGSYAASTESTLEDAQPEVNENIKEGEVQTSEPDLSVAQSGLCTASIEKTLEVAQLGGVEKVLKPPVLMENPLASENHVENDGCIGYSVSKKEDKTLDKDDSIMRNSTLSTETNSEVSSSELLTNDGDSDSPPSDRWIMPVQLPNSEKTPDSKNNARDSSNKRRSYTTSLHISINFASCSSENQKAASPRVPKIANLGHVVRAPAKKYKNSKLLQTSNRASVSGLFKHHSATPLPENRSVKPDGDPVSGTKSVHGKLQSPSIDSKFSNIFGSKVRSQTVPSSFTFKSEERAAKRKEFFQKLEQKSKSKETEKQQLHGRSQVKTRSNFKDLRSSIALKVIKDACVPSTTELPSNLTKKIPTVRPYVPKVEERAAFKAQDNDSRPPWRLAMKTERFKDATGKNSRLPISSAKCFSRKGMNENASPNIQL
ncbi:protein WVD2-like 7 [Sesamum indicum]|uniref:Protein WVD2-like 7 n=1 Tax=Sesamum indicum TaxID=4182 RepID=A0A6I9TLJ5_SESIN|nr:protein WVD2-like 7 [Sesamum indicum]